MAEGRQGKGSQTVERALDVLERIAAAKDPITTSEVARRSGLTRPTAHRLVTTLQERGYVTSVAGQRYRLGAQVLSLAATMLEGMRLQDVVRPSLLRLNELCDETVHLAVRQHQEVVYIDKVESGHAVRMHSFVGARGPLHCTSLGKSIWAFLPEIEKAALLKSAELVARTPQTITDRVELAEHLEQVRRQGFAFDEIENEEGIRCMGVPIFDGHGYPIAAMSISGPAFRLSSTKLQELAPDLMRESQQASMEFGHTPNS